MKFKQNKCFSCKQIHLHTSAITVLLLTVMSATLSNRIAYPFVADPEEQP